MQTSEQDIAVYERLGKDIFPKLVQYLKDSEKEGTKVINYKPGAELIKDFERSLEKGCDIDTLEGEIDQVLKYSANTHNPNFYDKLWVGCDAVGVVGEALTAFLNTAVHTYAVSPVASVLEMLTVRQFGRHCGFKEEELDGIFCPGGTMCNFLAMTCARAKHFPHVFKSGFRPEDRPVVFTSVLAHYSTARAAVLLGIGMENVVKVPVDAMGRMDPAALDAAITDAKAKGQTPFYVAATAGTTVLGSFDQLDLIADVTEKHNIWVHCDGAWGGSIILSPEYKHLMKGSERMNSITIDPHKAMSIPQQCSILLVRELRDCKEGSLRRACSLNAEYLFHPGPDAVYDQGDKSLNCGRKNDSLKLWLSWRYHGTDGYAKRFLTAYSNVQHIVSEIKKRDNFVLVMEPEFLNVCFWFIPPSARGHTGSDKEKQSLWAAAIPKIYSKMQSEGTLLVNHNPLPGLQLDRFFRLIVLSGKCDHSHMNFILDKIEEFGADL